MHHVPSLADLTLEERAALERAVDGPITPAMIADMLRGRASVGVPRETARHLRDLIAWARADLNYYRARVADLEHEIAGLMADREALYSDAEKDRKTRHIAVLNRQREGLLEHCKPYEAAIRDALGKLAEA